MKPAAYLMRTVPLAVALALGAGPAGAQSNPCSPRTTRNPCAGRNPCAAKRNPCAAQNPCAAKLDAKLITRPKGTKLYAAAPREALVKDGEKLWNDVKLSSNGLACNTCHQGGAAFQPTFAKPYPHQVAMVRDQAGLKSIQLDEMVQACMVMPMAAKPLAWDSRELAAITAYTGEVQKQYRATSAKGAANPCAAKNPCAARKNPCAANPCAAKRR